MKVIFMGTPEFSLCSLRALDGRGFEIAGVVTQPDKPQGRGNLMIPSPVKQYAMERGLRKYRIFQPRRAEEVVEELRALEPDFVVVVAFGQILRRPILELPRKAIINVHASILPKYRGASPINRAVINGETETGVTTMLLDEGMDTGDMLLVEKVRIEPRDTAGELHDRLAEAGAKLIVRTLEEFEKIVPLKQDHSQATYAPKLTKDSGRIDWAQPAEKIRNLMRGCNPWPSAFTYHNGIMLKVWDAEISGSIAVSSSAPGEIVGMDGGRINVATGDGALSILEVQREGKKRQPAETFLRGYTLQKGERLG